MTDNDKKFTPTPSTHIDIDVNEQTGFITFKQRRNQFSLQPDEVTMPIVQIKAIYHALLGRELALLGIAAQTMAGGKGT